MKAATRVNNPIEEVWRIRDEISAEYNYDIHRLFAALREEDKQSGDRLVRQVPRSSPKEPDPAMLREEPPKTE